MEKLNQMRDLLIQKCYQTLKRISTTALSTEKVFEDLVEYLGEQNTMTAR
jgi:hypothetical protein